ncbi:chemotaxis protein [Shewanella sp. YIC-542]|uniref:chemotaxis protein n=1 Tax=Shewanella mytili TaxID=3377111 RepID=UPI00398EA9B1
MTISSALSLATQGLYAAQTGLTQATVDVAQSTLPVANTPKEGSASEAMVDVMAAGQQGEAAAKVVQQTFETLGSIIDIEV